MNTFTTDKTKLIHHISRLEGQLASVKRELQKSESNCVKTSELLCAASRSFASLRSAFVSCFLEHEYLGTTVTGAKQKKYDSLLRVIKS